MKELGAIKVKGKDGLIPIFSAVLRSRENKVWMNTNTTHFFPSENFIP